MRQILHLLIVSRDRRRALAGRCGTRWLLPTMACGEHVRAGPLVAQWCRERNLAGDVAGQWLGRVQPEHIDWLMAFAARDASSTAALGLEWIEIDSLASGVSVLDYQSWALTRCLRGPVIPSVEGPFGNLEWPEHARAWIAASMGSAARAWTPYRTSAHEVVIGVETPRRPAFLKGLSGSRAHEPIVTQALAALVPESFAPTLAFENRGNGTVRWLAGKCPGEPSRDAPLVAAALARVQQQLTACGRTLPGLADLELDSAAAWACAGSGNPQHAEIIRDACAYARDAAMPHTWIPMDLDPSNVLVHDGRVRFVDVDDSFVGPALLPIATFARRCGDRAAYRACEQSWSPRLTGIDWRRLEISAAVFQAWRGWERLRWNVEHGEVFAALDALEARVRRRLARELYSR
jgi:hypothetical protein